MWGVQVGVEACGLSICQMKIVRARNSAGLKEGTTEPCQECGVLTDTEGDLESVVETMS